MIVSHTLQVLQQTSVYALKLIEIVLVVLMPSCLHPILAIILASQFNFLKKNGLAVRSILMDFPRYF